MNDDQLLDELGHALRPADEEPSAAEVAVLRAQVVEKLDQPTGPGWRRRGFAIVLAGALVAGTGTAVALGRDGVLPEPIRRAADAVGLPVDSVDVARTRSSMADLRASLESADPGGVTASAAALRNELADLSADERAEVEPEASELLERADRFLSAERASEGPPLEAGDELEDADDDRSGPGGGDDLEADDSSGPGSGEREAETEAGDDSGPGSSSDSSGSGSSGSSGSGSGGSGSSGSGSGASGGDG